MDPILAGITGLSLLLAIAMGFVLLKVLREERQRADARVALLSAAAADDELAFRSESDLDGFEPGPSPGIAGEMFRGDTDPRPLWPRRLAVAGGILGLAGILAFAFGAGGDGPPAAAIAPASDAPLELLALRYAQDAEALTISGVVLNPRTSRNTLTGVAATANLLGPDGGTLAAGSAALDYPALAPGDESPFVIRVPVQGAVSRYRVGFRAADGSVIAHVDRRAEGASARGSRNTGSVLPWAQ